MLASVGEEGLDVNLCYVCAKDGGLCIPCKRIRLQEGVPYTRCRPEVQRWRKAQTHARHCKDIALKGKHECNIALNHCSRYTLNGQCYTFVGVEGFEPVWDADKREWVHENPDKALAKLKEARLKRQEENKRKLPEWKPDQPTKKGKERVDE